MRGHSTQLNVVWLCLILHVFAGTGFANGLVICTAPGGHFALESPYLAARCAVPHEAREATELLAAVQNGTQRGCKDTPVFITGQKFAPASTVNAAPSPSQEAVVIAPVAPPVHRGAPGTTGSFSVFHSHALQSLRTIVLLV